MGLITALTKIYNGLMANDGTGDDLRSGAATINANSDAIVAAVNQLATAQGSGVKPFPTKAALVAVQATLPAGTVAVVFADPTAANNTSYVWDGAVLTTAYDRLTYALGNGSGFQQGGAGSTLRPFTDKARERVTPLDYMSASMIADVMSGVPVMDHSAAIQTAINTGFNIDFIGLKYNANNLVQTASGQTFSSSGGIARITKNANGAILASSGNNVHVKDINFYGDAPAPVYTGHNVTFSGNQCAMINCGSRWAYGRAVKATGSGFRIADQSDIYQTTDATATGYDIEIGVAGTATLYHELSGIYTSQKTGGLLFIDCGSQTVRGGQYGKLTISAGTLPAGVNGGKTIGGRILGDVNVGISSALFTGNQFGAVNVTLGAGTSKCSINESNSFENGSTVINLGNANNHIVRNVSGGGVVTLKYGADTSLAGLTITYNDPTQMFMFNGALVAPNLYGFKSLDSGGTARNIASMNASGQITFGTTSGAWNLLNGGTGSLYLAVNAASVLQLVPTALLPTADNAVALGSSGARYSTISVASGVINTSDEDAKDQIEPIPQAWLDAWAEVEWCRYKFRDAVAAKGDRARWHVGAVAQRVHAVFAKRNIDAFEIGLLCLDTWAAQAAEYVLDEKGRATDVIAIPAVEAGSRWGLRYDECFALEMALMRSLHKKAA